MKPTRTLSLLLAAAATATATFLRCGVVNAPPNDPSISALTDLERQQEREELNDTIVVNTYVHIITTEAHKAEYPRSMIQEQVNVLNAAYNESRISFRWIETGHEVVVNDSWAKGEIRLFGYARKFMPALKRGGYADLNLYFPSDPPGRNATHVYTLGTCTVPSRLGLRFPWTDATDGCVIAAQTMPGGRIKDYEQGLTAVHEVGHWLGLGHPFGEVRPEQAPGASAFARNCRYDADIIVDTPVQAFSTRGCPSSRNDSCPNHPGIDNANNYMDYSYDICMKEFTRGQIDRMHWMYNKSRAANSTSWEWTATEVMNHNT